MAHFTRFIVLVLACIPSILAAPSLPSRALSYKVLNNGTSGTVENRAADFGDGTLYHTSTFMTRGGCSSTAKIAKCYSAELSGDPTKMLETKESKDAQQLLEPGVGSHQRALLFAPGSWDSYPFEKSFTHKVRFHVSTAYKTVPAGADNEITLVSLKSYYPEPMPLKELAIKLATFTGEETSGTGFYVSMVQQDGSADFPYLVPLDFVAGKTVEATFKLGVDGATVDPSGVFVATVSLKVASTGEKLIEYGVTKTLMPKGILPPQHLLVFGADRKVSKNMGGLKIWFGDYSVSHENYPENRD